MPQGIFLMPQNGLLKKITRINANKKMHLLRYKLKNCALILICVIFFLNLCNLSFSERKMRLGENLIFDIYWKFVKVGYGTLEVKDVVDYNGSGRNAYVIYSEAQSAPFFDVFFKVRDANVSWIDVENFHSLEFRQKIREGKYKRDRRTVYDQKNHTAVNEKDVRFDIPENVLDVLGALYWVRLQELEPGTSVTVNVNARAKNYKMNVKIHAREKIKINGKKYKTIVVEPDLQDSGIFMQKGAVLIWLTDDEYHMPVKMKSKISVGSIVGELRGKE